MTWQVVGFLLILGGCGWYRRDLIAAGDYRLETPGGVGCAVTATAIEQDDTLHLVGRLKGVRAYTPVAGDVEVTLATPDGIGMKKATAELRNVNHRRGGHSHLEFEMAFDAIPPAGTVINVRPRIPLCTKASGG